MNILHLTPDFNYSDGRSYYVYLLLKYLKRNGHNVFLCTNSGDSFERINDSCSNIYVNNSLSDKLKFIKSVKFLKEIIEINKIDIIHSHHRYYELLANTAAKSFKNKTRTVFTALSIVDKRYSVEYKSDKIIAVSNSVKKMLTDKFNVKENKIVLIPNFVDSEEIIDENIQNEKQKFISKKNADKINILSVSRLHKDKDHLTLLKAIASLENKNINLAIVGEGPERNSIEDFSNKNNLNVKIIIPQKNLKEYYEKADLCILSSVRDPFPGFMLQSGLHRKAFIGSEVDGIGELIRNRFNGLLFRSVDYKDLAEKIEIFSEDKELSDLCSDNLHRTVVKNYTEIQIIPEIIKLYSELLN